MTRAPRKPNRCRRDRVPKSKVEEHARRGTRGENEHFANFLRSRYVLFTSPSEFDRGR